MDCPFCDRKFNDTCQIEKHLINHDQWYLKVYTPSYNRPMHKHWPIYMSNIQHSNRKIYEKPFRRNVAFKLYRMNKIQPIPLILSLNYQSIYSNSTFQLMYTDQHIDPIIDNIKQTTKNKKKYKLKLKEKQPTCITMKFTDGRTFTCMVPN